MVGEGEGVNRISNEGGKGTPSDALQRVYSGNISHTSEVVVGEV